MPYSLPKMLASTCLEPGVHIHTVHNYILKGYGWETRKYVHFKRGGNYSRETVTAFSSHWETIKYHLCIMQRQTPSILQTKSYYFSPSDIKACSILSSPHFVQPLQHLKLPITLLLQHISFPLTLFFFLMTVIRLIWLSRGLYSSS